MTTVLDLQFDGYTAVLQYNQRGEPALWITDNYRAGRVDFPWAAKRYMLEDGRHIQFVKPDEKLDEIVESWSFGPTLVDLALWEMPSVPMEGEFWDDEADL